MARKLFYSFHYDPDNWRVAQVRSMGIVEGNSPASDNDWEAVKRGGDTAIQRWIDGQFAGKSCAVVLIGSATAGRKWINYEIKKAWDEGKGLFGVYIHGLKNHDGFQSPMGSNPFADFSVGQTQLDSIVPAHLPPHSDSKEVYSYISTNLANWIEQAIQIRSRY